MTANERQVAGSHYVKHGELQHWDVVVHFSLDYFQGQITKYVFRWRHKNGVQDLEKAAHFLEKYIEVIRRQEDQAGAASNQAGGAYEPGHDEGITRRQVLPDGWVGYVFEGGVAEGDYFTCKLCKLRFMLPVEYPYGPASFHEPDCCMEAGPGYVNQDR